MRRRERLASLLLLVALIVAVKLAQQVYTWFAYADERAALQALSTRLESAGVAVIETQLAADSLRTRIQRLDGDLSDKKKAVGSFERFLRDGAIPAHLYDSYRAELDGYNRQVEIRNAEFNRWREVVVRNHEAVHRYNRLADSIRALATRIGEPYFQIPTPAELAVQRGLIWTEDGDPVNR